MIELWTNANKWLNSYGGLISTISFIVSVFIYFKTGQIKKSIKSLLSHEKYNDQKKKAKMNLQGILESIEKDNIFDEKLLGEIHREISALEHYTVFFDRKMNKNMKDIQKVLKNNFSDIKKEEIIITINKILGDLDISEVYIG